ncbi:MAG: hypothetical protein DWQ49_09935 [Bacteroidetes bacterium]|nr:MAG: hypothetical protein DWQ49_09935 [Bacteroidota bacterium]
MGHTATPDDWADYVVDFNNGNNSNSGEYGAPLATIENAIGRIGPGGKILIKDGVSNNLPDNIINDNSGGINYYTIPSGINAANPTIIRAENPFRTKIRFTTPGILNYFDHIIGLLNASNVWVDGIVYEHLGGADPEWTGYVGGSNTLSRSLGMRNEANTYGGVMSTGGNNVLFQDCAFRGAGRYIIQASGNSSDINHIYRRMLLRQDAFPNQGQPKGTFNWYGGNSGVGPGQTGQSELQTVIVLDGNGSFVGSGLEQKYGGIMHAHSSSGIIKRDCIVYNEEVYHAGFWNGESSNGASYDNDIINCIAWRIKGNSGGAPAAGINDSTTLSHILDQLTIGQCDGTNNASGNTATNSYISDTVPADLLNVPGGASIQKIMGAFMSRYGEPGYNLPTSEDLWPNYPYESEIRREFQIQHANASGHTPAVTANRGWVNNPAGLYDYLNKDRASA